MNNLADTRRTPCASNERGGARFNFLLVVALIGGFVYAGSQYVPVAIQAYQFKDLMYQKVTYAAATGIPIPTKWIEKELQASLSDYGIPPSAKINAQQIDGRLVARVQWIRPIQLPGYVYQYNFDHTTKSDSFLTPK